MNFADIAPGLHAVWDDNPSAESREQLVEKIDAFAPLLEPNTINGVVSAKIWCECRFYLDAAPRAR